MDLGVLGPRRPACGVRALRPRSPGAAPRVTGVGGTGPPCNRRERRQPWPVTRGGGPRGPQRKLSPGPASGQVLRLRTRAPSGPRPGARQPQPHLRAQTTRTSTCAPRAYSHSPPAQPLTCAWAAAAAGGGPLRRPSSSSGGSSSSTRPRPSFHMVGRAPASLRPCVRLWVRVPPGHRTLCLRLLRDAGPVGRAGPGGGRGVPQN